MATAPRIYYGNFDFEHRLANAQFAPTAKLKQLNAELAAAWLAIAEDGDFIWTPGDIDSQFFDALHVLGLPRVHPVTSLADVPAGTERVPWGRSTQVRQLCQKFGWTSRSPHDQAVRIANSRTTSARLEDDWNVGLTGSCLLRSLDDLTSAIAHLGGAEPLWVVKADFSMSARERILGKGEPGARDLDWLRSRLSTGARLHFEPWVQRLAEIGVQIQIPETGVPGIVGWTPMQVDARGQYAGSWFANEPIQSAWVQNSWNGIAETVIRIACELQSIGYFGPVGLDVMRYRQNDGSEAIRVLQDINARWTMGRLSLGWSRLLKPGEVGLWQHSSRPFEVPPDFSADRIIETGPTVVGGINAHHRSRLVIGRSLCSDL